MRTPRKEESLLLLEVYWSWQHGDKRVPQPYQWTPTTLNLLLEGYWTRERIRRAIQYDQQTTWPPPTLSLTWADAAQPSYPQAQVRGLVWAVGLAE